MLPVDLILPTSKETHNLVLWTPMNTRIGKREERRERRGVRDHDGVAMDFRVFRERLREQNSMTLVTSSPHVPCILSYFFSRALFCVDECSHPRYRKY